MKTRVITTTLEFDTPEEYAAFLDYMHGFKGPAREQGAVIRTNRQIGQENRENFDYGKLSALLDAGWSLTKIAKEMHVSITYIHNRAADLDAGNVPDPRPEEQEGE